MAKRTSYIEKRLEILINIGNYESLRVGTLFGENIEWSTKEERQKKLNGITKSLKEEVSKDVNDVLDSFDLRKKATSTLQNGRVKNKFFDNIAEEENDDNDDDFNL